MWKAAAEFLWNPKRMDSSMVVTVTSSYTLILKGRSSTHGMYGQLCTDLQYVDTISCSLCVLLRRVESHINAALFNMSWTCSIISRPFGNGAQPLYFYLLIYFYHVFLRQGACATKDELTASAFLTVQLDRSLNDQAVQVSVFRMTVNRAYNMDAETKTERRR